ncbi:Hint domain-containing protein [Celeribacter neptunius]|uniref:Ca2+-binding protein, RTX toxin-related n=1 Tax=Celeribacter neptunius TaxID=588602 RepID=A0A1I3KZB8_9RHOB|nr:Hint domain-containing protein [Celeribacter neptunius]SFI77760.1 Ca2+-binding protein, RTX toxin-related [Celeribacter neptunius]
MTTSYYDPYRDYDSSCDPTTPTTDGIVEGTAGDDLIDVAYTGDPEGDMIDGADGLNDIVYAGDGDDTVLGGEGNDTIYGDTGATETTSTETFSWSSLADTDYCGYGTVDNGEDLTGDTLVQNTGSVIVTVTTPELDCSWWDGDDTVTSSFSTSTMNTDGVDGASASSSLSSLADAGETGTYDVAFSDEVENVTFNISDIDANLGQVTVIAYDADGNEIPVTFEIGSDLTLSGNTVTAADTDNVTPADDSNTVTVSIAGPVASFEVIHTNPGTGTSGINISDVSFSVTTVDETGEGEGDDTLIGGAGDDTIFGQGGNDTLQGDAGTNYLDGGDGDDTFIGGEGADTFRGGRGQDNIDYSGSDAAVNVDLSTSTLSGGDADNDTIESGIDGVIGSEYDDVLTGFDHQGTTPEDTYTNEFWGMGGDDTISGGGGDDYLDGGDGNDVIEGGDGDDIIIGGPDGTPDRGYGPYLADDADPYNDRDILMGGAGNDTIYGGDDNDIIDGGADDDHLDGGYDDDTITGGTGNDTIIGGEGSDTIDGGDGDDIIYGGLDPAYPDSLNVPDDAGDLEVENGKDVIDGGAGNDTIYGQDDDDLIYGGDGDDYIDGGIDDDTIYAGAGTDMVFGGEDEDTIYGGGDNDVLDGGDDQDTIYVTFSDVTTGVYNTTVHGGDGGIDWDTLDLGALISDGWVITHHVQNPDSDGNGFDGQIQLYNAGTDEYANINYTNIEEVIPCFTPGTLIATPKGEMKVETLSVGDRVITRDNGIQAIRWIGKKILSGAELAARGALNPVMIRQGALGAGLPERDMLVSPNHRMLVSNEKAALLFEEHEVLVAAKHLTRMEGVDVVEASEVTYIHVMFDRHEVVLSDGTWSESFQPGDYTLAGIDDAARDELFTLFPELEDVTARGGFSAARRILRKHEAELLVN